MFSVSGKIKNERNVLQKVTLTGTDYILHNGLIGPHALAEKALGEIREGVLVASVHFSNILLLRRKSSHR